LADPVGGADAGNAGADDHDVVIVGVELFGQGGAPDNGRYFEVYPSTASAVVDELQRHLEVRVLEQRDHGLQIVPLLTADAHLVALDLGLDVFGPLVTDELGDLLRVLAVDALLERAGDLEALAGLHRVARLEGLHADVAPDELLLEDVDGGLDALLGARRDL